MAASSNPEPPGGNFEDTQWAVVSAAQSDAVALEQICRAYWAPLYAFVRRRGYNAHEAQELTQQYFAWLIEWYHIAAAPPQRGRFRSFLLAALKHFLADKRRGGHKE